MPENNIPAFQLHQSTERYYSALLLVLTDYKPKTHDLEVLGSFATAQEVELLEVFPKGTKEEKDRSELLRRGYVDASYDDKYTITHKELEWLASRVETLRNLTEEICNKKINSFTS